MQNWLQRKNLQPQGEAKHAVFALTQK